MDREGWSDDLIVKEGGIEFFDLPDHVVDGVVPDVAKRNVDGDPSDGR